MPGFPASHGGTATGRLTWLVGEFWVLTAGLAVRCRMLRAWCLGTAGDCWHRGAHEYYVQNIWMRATEANEELVWDKPPCV